jgi:ketopantoate reductase
MPKYMVIGQGSMGTRRVRCLLANNVSPEQIVAFDTQQERLDTSQSKYGIQVTSDDPPVNTPTNQPAEINRVLVGGSFMTGDTAPMWVAYRHEDPPELRHRCLGFRLAL